ncbi:MAG: rhizopine catabolism protein [Rhodospirillaceae bacterium]|jgi:fatty acid desaturase|nr:rhizopine catabolism protein [Rhodospirillaceae bacterium]MBT6119569.1 rhizopine catabolism protein [Rhodospirillaceae bacterium]
MDDFIGRKGLVESARLKALSRPSNMRGLTHLAGHLAVILGTGTALYFAWGSWWGVPVFVLHGLALNYLYAAQHECSHWTAFETRRLNDFVGAACGFLVFWPHQHDQAYHFTHHRHTQDPARDPEIMGEEGGSLTRGGFLLSLTGLPYWLRRAKNLVRVARGDTSEEPYLTARQRPAVVAEARWTLLGYALIAGVSVALGTWAAAIYWVGPVLLTKWTHQPQNLIEHTGMPHEGDTVTMTRTVRTNRVLRFLLWNMPYHMAHHTYPGVPFWRLPELHAEMAARLPMRPVTAGYLEFIARMAQSLPRRAETPQPAE